MAFLRKTMNADSKKRRTPKEKSGSQIKTSSSPSGRSGCSLPSSPRIGTTSLPVCTSILIDHGPKFSNSRRMRIRRGGLDLLRACRSLLFGNTGSSRKNDNDIKDTNSESSREHQAEVVPGAGVFLFPTLQHPEDLQLGDHNYTKNQTAQQEDVEVLKVRRKVAPHLAVSAAQVLPSPNSLISTTATTPGSTTTLIAENNKTWNWNLPRRKKQQSSSSCGGSVGPAVQPVVTGDQQRESQATPERAKRWSGTTGPMIAKNEENQLSSRTSFASIPSTTLLDEDDEDETPPDVALINVSTSNKPFLWVPHQVVLGGVPVQQRSLSKCRSTGPSNTSASINTLSKTQQQNNWTASLDTVLVLPSSGQQQSLLKTRSYAKERASSLCLKNRADPETTPAVVLGEGAADPTTTPPVSGCKENSAVVEEDESENKEHVVDPKTTHASKIGTGALDQDGRDAKVAGVFEDTEKEDQKNQGAEIQTPLENHLLVPGQLLKTRSYSKVRASYESRNISPSTKSVEEYDLSVLGATSGEAAGAIDKDSNPGTLLTSASATNGCAETDISSSPKNQVTKRSYCKQRSSAALMNDNDPRPKTGTSSNASTMKQAVFSTFMKQMNNVAGGSAKTSATNSVVSGVFSTSEKTFDTTVLINKLDGDSRQAVPIWDSILQTQTTSADGVGFYFGTGQTTNWSDKKTTSKIRGTLNEDFPPSAVRTGNQEVGVDLFSYWTPKP